MVVEEVMTSNVVTVTPDTPLKDVAELLVEKDISGLPVVDEEGKVLGVVSETDILYKERGEAPDKRSLIGHLLHWGEKTSDPKIDARTAGEAMTSPPIVVAPATSVARAAAMMADAGVHRLVVVDDAEARGAGSNGKLRGIVSRSDFVRAFARSDAQVKQEIDELIDRQIWVPAGVTTSVHRGEVTVAGTVELESTAESLVSMLRRIPGVVSVDSQLTWTREPGNI